MCMCIHESPIRLLPKLLRTKLIFTLGFDSRIFCDRGIRSVNEYLLFESLQSKIWFEH